MVPVRIENPDFSRRGFRLPHEGDRGRGGHRSESSHSPDARRASGWWSGESPFAPVGNRRYAGASATPHRRARPFPRRDRTPFYRRRFRLSVSCDRRVRGTPSRWKGCYFPKRILLIEKAGHEGDPAKFELVMRTALRAQGQCAQTLRVLGEVRNPKSVAFIKQQNVGAVQQINNGALTRPQDSANEPQTISTRGGVCRNIGAERNASDKRNGFGYGVREHSTGPRTLEGKSRVSRNACKGATREMLRSLSRLLRLQKKSLDDLI